MKSLVQAINNLAQAINNLASSHKPKEILNKTVSSPSFAKTSNPYSGSVNVTSYSYSAETTTVSKDEANAMKQIYTVITDTGSYHEHSTQMMRDLKVKWPSLHSALIALIDARAYYKPSEKNNQYPNGRSEQIWKKK